MNVAEGFHEFIVLKILGPDDFIISFSWAFEFRGLEHGDDARFARSTNTLGTRSGDTDGDCLTAVYSICGVDIFEINFENI